MFVLDLAIIAAGAVALAASFLSYYTASVAYATDSTTAWHGFYGWFGAVLATLGAAVVATGAGARRGERAVLRCVLALLLYCLAAVSTFLALFTKGYTTSRVIGASADTGHGYGYWTCLAATTLGAVLSGLRLAYEFRYAPPEER